MLFENEKIEALDPDLDELWEHHFFYFDKQIRTFIPQNLPLSQNETKFT